MQSLGESAEVVNQVLKSGISLLMNLAAKQGGDPSPSTSTLSTTTQDAYFVNFNQDYTSLSIGSKNGYRIYTISSIDKLELIHDAPDDVCHVERLFSSSLLGIVHRNSPRKLNVLHFKRKAEICQYTYTNTILAIRLNRLRVVVCLDDSLYIHNIRDMKLLHTIRDTPHNPLGLCALSVGNENCFLAYPGNVNNGEVQVFDADTLQAKSMIPAHDNPIAALAFNPSGTLMATASKKGTVIRVFSVVDGARLFEFRRGMKRCVTIYSLTFSPNSTFLCASSNTETVHIFKLEKDKESQPMEDNQGWMGYVGKALMTSANYLPTQFSDMLHQDRNFATFYLPFSQMKNVCCITTIQKQSCVLVASADGFLYIYQFDTDEGGDCALIKQHRVDGKEDLSLDQTVGSSSSSSGGSSTSAVGGTGFTSTGISYSAAVRKLDKGGNNDGE